MLTRAAAGVVLFIAACSDRASRDKPSSDKPSSLVCEPTLSAFPTGYTDGDNPVPRHFLEGGPATVAFVDNTSAENQVTNAGAQLGRVLFYDVRLSADNSISCASCHKQKYGFGDTSRTSRGIHGRTGTRRTLALANARFNSSGRFFWDERATSLEEQVLQPVRDTLEMGMPVKDLDAKLSATSYYPGLFAAAFGSREITDERISQALAQFVRTLVSSQSRFDAVFATGGAPNPNALTADEREGERLFMSSGCVNCHRTVAQIADKPTNIGLDAVPIDTGAGQGRFKPASLRNAAVRPPYMHDGRFGSLREVVGFYSTGVKDGRDLDPRLRGADGMPRHLNLTPRQIETMVAFLESLTDSAFLRAERFSNPFPCTS